MTDKRSTYRVNADGWWILADILREPKEFNPDLSRKWESRGSWSGWKYTGALRGRKGAPLSFGRMSDPDAIRTLEYYRDRGMVDYVVYSYDTPIAYRILNKYSEPVWFSLEEKYSVTTSKHQGRVFTAISQINGD